MRGIGISKELCIFTVLIMCIGLIWANMAGAANTGGLPQCQSDLTTCNGSLSSCNTNLATCHIKSG
jgi:hypothetical protein